MDRTKNIQYVKKRLACILSFMILQVQISNVHRKQTTYDRTTILDASKPENSIRKMSGTLSTTPELTIPVACTILYNVEVPSCYTTDQGSSSRKCYFALMQNSCRLAYREH